MRAHAWSFITGVLQRETRTIPIIFASVSIVARFTPPERRNVAEARSDALPALERWLFTIASLR
jgi:hypothetical protein